MYSLTGILEPNTLHHYLQYTLIPALVGVVHINNPIIYYIIQWGSLFIYIYNIYIEGIQFDLDGQMGLGANCKIWPIYIRCKNFAKSL